MAATISGRGIDLWDVSEPTEPIQLSTFVSEHNTGEAESHQVTFARTSDGRTLAATISGRGIDLWDVSDARAPMHLSHMFLEGVDYGDNSRAVWGIYWQGDFIYVGGTNTGLHIVDASTPEEPTLVLKMPTSEFGGVSAGPLWALGNLLVVTTPKNHAGVVTMDIGDPAAPSVLDVEIPEEDAYIGGFFEGRAYLVNPLRTYDVTTDPSNITLLGHAETSDSEYMSFGDGLMFMGSLRPWPGVYKVDISDPNAPRELEYIEGRRDDFFGGLLTDDQFSIPIGNLLVLSDDERDIGSALVVHSPQRDTTAPKVSVVHPPDGATRQPITTRIGVSFTDQIDLRSVTVDTLIVRPLGGGAPLTGTVGHVQTVVNFWPDAPLEPNTTYEVVLPVGGVTDLVGNALTEETRTIFSTGDNIAAAPCAIAPLEPVSVGAPAHFDAEQAQGEAVYRWDFGDGESSEGSTPVSSHTYQAPGRIRVTLTVVAPQGQRSCSALQIVHRPLAEPRPQRASSVVVDAERGQAWVVNPDADTITAVDLETWTPTREVPV
ncbi:MAG: Ig-like domain-containing protein, partial [Myxococcota bacterium]